jgi:4'-phosphopantetheinyl transferase
MHVEIVGPVCVWVVRLPAGSAPSAESLDFAERLAARRLCRPADRACFVAGRALRRRALATFAQEPAERLRFATSCERCGDERHGRPRLVGHEEISFSLGTAWVAGEDAHAIVLAVSRGVDVGVGVAADAAVAALEPGSYMAGDEPALGAAAAWAGKDAVLRLTGGGGHYVDPREVRLGPDVALGGERRPDVRLGWRPLPGACAAIAWAARERAALALAELHDAGGAGVDRVVAADAGAVARLEARAALADDDLAAGHGLPGEHLDAEALGVGVAAVAAGAEALLVRHLVSSPCRST